MSDIKENQKYCPKCNNIITYKHKYYRNKSFKNKSLCRICINEEYKTKFLGENNPFYGKHHTEETKEKIRKNNHSGIKFTGKRLSEARRTIKIAKKAQQNKNFYQLWIDKYGIEAANLKLIEFKKKQSILNSGKNNSMYGKPSPRGSGNGWACWYKNIHFRSLRELTFFIVEIENKNIKWENGQSKKFQIKYIGYNGQERTYRPDFFLVDTKELVEIKPKKLWNTPQVLLKKFAAEIFCKNKKYKYKLVDIEIESDILKEKYLNKEIIFVDKYKDRFEKYAKIK